MTTNKRLGLMILILVPVVLILFIVGVLYFGYELFELIVFVAVAASLGLFGWIGYSLFTEPPVPRGTIDGRVDDDVEAAAAENAGIQSRFSVIQECEIGEGTIVRDHVNLYRCRIGRDCKIESFVYMEEGVTIGDRCKVKPGANIPTGVTIEDDVFVGPYATFTNDKRPRVGGSWQMRPTIVCKGASIGARALILPGLRIGRNALVGAGAVVTKDVPDETVVVGNPAKSIGKTVYTNYGESPDSGSIKGQDNETARERLPLRKNVDGREVTESGALTESHSRRLPEAFAARLETIRELKSHSSQIYRSLCPVSSEKKTLRGDTRVKTASLLISCSRTMKLIDWKTDPGCTPWH